MMIDAETESLLAGSASALKTCIDCGFPFPLAAFYTSTSSTDGRQPRCKGCDKKHKDESGQSLRAKAAAIARRDADEKEPIETASEKPAAPVTNAKYVYEGVRDGYLIYGYIR
jgi:hypothetical protein